jgi:hypothetical protein
VRTVKTRLVAAFVVLQCLLILLGSEDSEGSSRLAHAPAALTYYAELSGALGNYRFFSPNVADPVVADIELSRAGKRRWHIEIGRGATELDFRQSTAMIYLAGIGLPNLQSRIVAAWALGLHRECDTAYVKLGHRVTPTMAAYRAGRRPYNEFYYEAEYKRRSRPAPLP